MATDKPVGDFKFTWGDSVQVLNVAPAQYSPGEFASIVGLCLVDNPIVSKSFGLPIGTKVYTVEFGNGASKEIPEQYLDLL